MNGMARLSDSAKSFGSSVMGEKPPRTRLNAKNSPFKYLCIARTPLKAENNASAQISWRDRFSVVSKLKTKKSRITDFENTSIKKVRLPPGQVESGIKARANPTKPRISLTSEFIIVIERP